MSREALSDDPFGLESVDDDDVGGAGDEIEMQIVDCAVFNERKTLGGGDGTSKNRVHTYIFGRGESGKSFTVEVADFRPYFYIQVPRGWATDMLLRAFGHALSTVFRVDVRVSLEWRSHAKGYRFDSETKSRRRFPYAKTSFRDLSELARVKRALAPDPQGNRRGEWECTEKVEAIVLAMKKKMDGLDPPPVGVGDREALTAQHTSCPLPQQFLASIGTRACGWIRVKPRKGALDGGARFANTDCECAARVSDIEALEEISASAPLLIASFDIECMSGSGDFPSPARPLDKVIQVGVSYSKLGVAGIHRRVVLCLGETSTDVKVRDPSGRDGGASIEILVFERESELLAGYSTLLRQSDPDIVTGFNVLDFDWYYICARVALFEALRPSVNAAQLMREARRIAGDYKYFKARHDNEDLPERARMSALERVCDMVGERFWEGCRFPPMPLRTSLLAKMTPEDAEYFANQEPPEFAYCGRLQSEAHHLQIQNLQSAAMGDNVLRRFDMLGRCSLDLFLHIKNMVRTRTR